MAYNRKKGSLSGFVRFRGSPDGVPSFITLFAGIRTATGCDGYPRRWLRVIQRRVRLELAAT